MVSTYPSEKWWSESHYIPNIWKVIIQMFQTTNQLHIRYIKLLKLYLYENYMCIYIITYIMLQNHLPFFPLRFPWKSTNMFSKRKNGDVDVMEDDQRFVNCWISPPIFVWILVDVYHDESWWTPNFWMWKSHEAHHDKSHRRFLGVSIPICASPGLALPDIRLKICFCPALTLKSWSNSVQRFLGQEIVMAIIWL